jgi:hypothetical protein
MRLAPFEIVVSSAGTPPRQRVGRRGQRHRLDVRTVRRPELAVSRCEQLVARRSVLVDLQAHHPARDRTRGAVERLVDLRDVDLFEGIPGDVLGPVHVADLRVRRHNHREWTIDACLPGALGREDEAIDLVIEDGLPQVPHRPVVGLRVEVDRGLLQAAVEEGHVLRDQHAHALTGRPFDDLRERQERGLGVEDLAVDVSVEDRGIEIGDREQRVGHRGGVRERRGHEVATRGIRCQRKITETCGVELRLGRLRDRGGRRRLTSGRPCRGNRLALGNSPDGTHQRDRCQADDGDRFGCPDLRDRAGHGAPFLLDLDRPFANRGHRETRKMRAR